MSLPAGLREIARAAIAGRMAAAVFDRMAEHPHTKILIDYLLSRFPEAPTRPPDRLSRMGDLLIACWSGDRALSMRLEIRVLEAVDGDPCTCPGCGDRKEALHASCPACWHDRYGHEEDDDE